MHLCVIRDNGSRQLLGVHAKQPGRQGSKHRHGGMPPHQHVLTLVRQGVHNQQRACLQHLAVVTVVGLPGGSKPASGVWEACRPGVPAPHVLATGPCSPQLNLPCRA